MNPRTKLSLEKEEELYKSVVPIAKEFRLRFLDRNRPIEDTFQTLEKLGYLILRFPTDENLSGFHIKKGEKLSSRFIIIIRGMLS